MTGSRISAACANTSRLWLVRYPAKGVRWRKIVTAMTPILHSYGVKCRDLYALDGPFDDEQAALFERAYADDSQACRAFDLWDWIDGRFELKRGALL